MASRSGLSNNWRVKSEALPKPRNPTAEAPRRQRGWGSQHDADSSRGEKRLQSDKSGSKEIRGEDDPRTLQAIAEGRRLYVGNMPYMAKTRDVEELFADGDYKVEHINMSTDPFTGRNPSYCFVELQTKEQADKAMQELNGKDLLGRPIKLGPGIAKARGKRPVDNGGVAINNSQAPFKAVFDRWTRIDAPDHWNEYNKRNRRLIVSGLPKILRHDTVNKEVRDLFRDFTIEAVSKLIVPSEGDLLSPQPHNNRYLFVDFATAEEADQAVKATDGRHVWNVTIRVGHAKARGSNKAAERDKWEVEQRRG